MKLQIMLKNKLGILLIILLFLISIFFYIPQNRIYNVTEVNSSTEFVLDNKDFKIDGIESFDTEFTEHNSNLAKNLNITETEAFIFGNLSKYWTANLMKGRKVYVTNNNDLQFLKFRYKEKFKYSGYCLINSKPFDEGLFEKRLTEIRKANFVVLDLNTHEIYKMTSPHIKEIKDFLIVRKNHISKELLLKESKKQNQIKDLGDIKVLLTDFTTQIFPTRECSSNICKEILTNINNSTDSIDMAIYGYSSTPAIENAIIAAKNRGVKIRLVYDLNQYGKNIYPDTEKFLKLIDQTKNDYFSENSQYIMHNKFYIFDKKTLITGSANLSHTDMSGYNSNSIVVIKSPKLAEM